jgi:hypothetical protein
VSRPVAWFGAIQFVLLQHGVALFLWHADRMPLSQSAVWLAALAAGLWATGVMRGRLTVLEVLLVEAAALDEATGAESLIQWHLVLAAGDAAGDFHVADPPTCAARRRGSMRC